MNQNPPVPLSIAAPEKPIDFKGVLSDFSEGQFCFVVARRYQGTGPIRLILHEAAPTPEGGFGYGHGKHWTVGIGSLLGGIDSERRRQAARENGKKGGKPKGRPSPKHSVSTATTNKVRTEPPHALSKALDDLARLTPRTREPLYGGLLKKPAK